MPEVQRKEPKDIGDYFAWINAIIVGLNILIFVFVDLSNSSENTEWMLKCGAMYWPYVLERGEYYRLFTSMFLHFGVTHLFNNMLILWFIGGTLEQRIGAVRFAVIYFLSGILAGSFSMGYNIMSGQTPVSAGASGAIFGVIGALLYVVLQNRGHTGGFTKRQMLVFIFLSLYGGFTSQGVDNIAHVGGFLSGFLLALICYRRPKDKEQIDWRNTSYDED